jgi:hypothetical protein
MAPAPRVCGVQQKVTFTSKSTQTWNASGASGTNIIWYRPYGPCTYSKA